MATPLKETSTFHIREVQVSDAPRVLALMEGLDRETAFMLYEPGERRTTVREQAETLQWFVEADSHGMWVAVQGDELVGFILARGNRNRRSRHGVSCVIGVLQSASGQGLGQRLLQTLEAWAQKRGVTRLELTVMAHNAPARALYRKQGFAEEGVRRQALQVEGVWVDEIYMAKLLKPTLRFSCHTGEELQPYVVDLARLRMRVFRDFPYLYVGDQAYEENYLHTYIQAPDSVVVLAWSGATLVGASTGTPLSAETPEVQAPFVTDASQRYPVAETFYCGESVLLPAYRGLGAGVAFFEYREAHARALGYRWICFCAVQRPEDHPQRPSDYVPLDAFWHKRGYCKEPSLQTTFDWQEIGEAQASPKPMTFWVKAL